MPNSGIPDELGRPAWIRNQYMAMRFSEQQCLWDLIHELIPMPEPGVEADDDDACVLELLCVDIQSGIWMLRIGTSVVSFEPPDSGNPALKGSQLLSIRPLSEYSSGLTVGRP